MVLLSVKYRYVPFSCVFEWRLTCGDNNLEYISHLGMFLLVWDTVNARTRIKEFPELRWHKCPVILPSTNQNLSPMWLFDINRRSQAYSWYLNSKMRRKSIYFLERAQRNSIHMLWVYLDGYLNSKSLTVISSISTRIGRLDMQIVI